MRVPAYSFVSAILAGLPIHAQIAEPILTKTPIPFVSGAGSVKLDYAGGIGRAGGNSQVIPQVIVEVGIYQRLEVLARFPLLRVTLQSPDSSVIGGGQLAMGARYLLAGGAERGYAVSVQAVVETPTGDTRLVGNATQVMPSVLANWHPVKKIAIYSNLTFDRSIGGGTPKAAFVEYQNAVAWRATSHVVPLFEIAGSTNTITGTTQLVAQPGMNIRTGPHLEWKAGIQRGLNPRTARTGLRTQIAWFWGKRK
jgi:hypothetical protein